VAHPGPGGVTPVVVLVDHRLIGGTIIVEQIFSLPGVGRVVIDAATKNDYTLVQGGVLIIAVVYVTVNLIVDVLYSYLDPRIRRGRV
jgi:peptide/nickel transport system permease protein